MKKARLPKNEVERLAALRRYEVLDTTPERAYDDIVKIASQVCGTPIALISLVDSDRQWFKAKVGLEASETPRDVSFCAHAIVDNQLLVVEDAAADHRFAANPLVTGEPRIGFYAGAPLVTAEGLGMGSLCVIDHQARQLSVEQRETLEALARLVVANLEYRRVSATLATQLQNVKELGGMLPICCHCKKIRDDKGYWDRVETYVAKHTHANFTHSYCPDCAEVYFPGLTGGELGAAQKK
jgi:GAF domain-containing protein